MSDKTQAEHNESAHPPIADMKADIDFCRSGSIASIERRPWHVGFTPDSGRIVAAQRTDAMGQ
jgi:hypothetical protein